MKRPSLDEFLTKAKRQWGAGIIDPASQKATRISRLPSGIDRLDEALAGGFPVGRISLIYGKKSSGKSSLALRLISQAQKRCKKCLKEECNCRSRKLRAAYLDIEGTFDYGWADILGLDLDELLLSRPEFAEQAIDIAEGLLSTGEVDILVVDSIASMVPLDEKEESASKWQVGLLARLVNKFIRKIVGIANEFSTAGKTPPTIILINQIRQNIGAPAFLDSEVLPGGMACGFATSLEIRKWSGPVQKAEAGWPGYVELNFAITKSKVSQPKLQGSYLLILQAGLNKKVGEIFDERWLLDEAVRFGLIQRQGHKYQFNGFSASNKLEAVKYLISEKDYRGRIYAEVRRIRKEGG